MSVGSNSSQSSSSMTSQNSAFANSFMNSFANSFNNSNQAASSFIDKTQAPYLQAMYEQAMGAANPQGVTSAAQGASNSIIPGMQSAFDSIAAMTNPNGQIEAQSQSLKSGLGSMFREELMPAIKAGAIGSGGFGGGRQGVAEGQAVGQIADAYTAGYGDIVASARANALGAAQTIPGLAQGLYSSATAPQMAGLDALSRLASILGSPTVLSTSKGVSRGGSTSTASSRSKSRSQGSARSGSESESSGWSFGIPL